MKDARAVNVVNTVNAVSATGCSDKSDLYAHDIHGFYGIHEIHGPSRPYVSSIARSCGRWPTSPQETTDQIPSRCRNTLTDAL